MESGESASGPSYRRWIAVFATAAVVLAVFGFIHWNRPGLDRFPVRGIDVSHHQGEIDWTLVSASKIHFAFIKATEGKDFMDTRFETNWRSADEAGLLRGAYHFFTFCTPGDAQADHFLAVVPPVERTLPPGVDVEFAGNCKSWKSIEAIREELAVFLDRLEGAWGRTPLLYVTSESKDRILKGHFGRYPTWIRSVFFRPGGREPEWLFWQYTDDGTVPGIDTPVDLNIYRGQPSELFALVR